MSALTPDELIAARALVALIKRGEYRFPDLGPCRPSTFVHGRERHKRSVWWFSESRAHGLQHVGNDDGQFS